MLQTQEAPVGPDALSACEAKGVALVKQRMRPPATETTHGQPTNAEFVALLPAFRSTGGLATGYEVAARIDRSQTPGVATVGRRIANRELVSFLWNGHYWMPWFQFARDMQLTPAAEAVIGELRQDLDGWELTRWFGEPQPFLGGRTPVSLIGTESATVVDAARLARFIARGC